MSLLQQDQYIVCRCYNKISISFVVVTTRSGYRLSLLQQDQYIVCRCYNKIRISFVVLTTRSVYRLSLLRQNEDIVCRCYKSQHNISYFSKPLLLNTNLNASQTKSCPCFGLHGTEGICTEQKSKQKKERKKTLVKKELTKNY